MCPIFVGQRRFSSAGPRKYNRYFRRPRDRRNCVLFSSAAARPTKISGVFSSTASRPTKIKGPLIGLSALSLSRSSNSRSLVFAPPPACPTSSRRRRRPPARPPSPRRPHTVPPRAAPRRRRRRPPAHRPSRAAHHSRAPVHHRRAGVRARPLSTRRRSWPARAPSPLRVAARGSPFVHAVHRSRLVHAVPAVHAVRPRPSSVHAVSSVHVVVVPRGEPPRLPSFPTYLMLVVACRACHARAVACRARGRARVVATVRVRRVVACRSRAACRGDRECYLSFV
jgi:hypothetical protein